MKKRHGELVSHYEAQTEDLGSLTAEFTTLLESCER